MPRPRKYTEHCTERAHRVCVLKPNASFPYSHNDYTTVYIPGDIVAKLKLLADELNLTLEEAVRGGAYMPGKRKSVSYSKAVIESAFLFCKAQASRNEQEQEKALAEAAAANNAAWD